MCWSDHPGRVFAAHLPRVVHGKFVFCVSGRLRPTAVNSFLFSATVSEDKMAVLNPKFLLCSWCSGLYSWGSCQIFVAKINKSVRKARIASALTGCVQIPSESYSGLEKRKSDSEDHSQGEVSNTPRRQQQRYQWRRLVRSGTTKQRDKGNQAGAVPGFSSRTNAVWTRISVRGHIDGSGRCISERDLQAMRGNKSSQTHLVSFGSSPVVQSQPALL